MAVFGAGIAPSLLAWGLQRSGATTGSLLLNLEAVFTVLLARAVYREPIGRRVATALCVMSLGGVALALNATFSATFDLAGAAAVAGATLAWAIDNTLSRALAEQDPGAVVFGKCALGALLTGLLSTATKEQWPGPSATLGLLACGATGYGASLRLYYLAQRRIGAVRTGSIFARAPFIGAALGWLLGDKALGPWTPPACALFITGVILHVTERHEHAHIHPQLEHEHTHRHDDGHHGHVHQPPFVGEHTHWHWHAETAHSHDHAPDLHHDHQHT
jgi:drug/metabolite transporter (DMT)-like permease